MILFTEKLNRMYKAIRNTGNKLEIKLELVKNTEMLDGGLCTLIKQHQQPYIEIKIRADRLNEEVVSHELLHALFIQMGFGQTAADSVEGIPFQQIGVLLRSVIEHKSIYAIQMELGIDTVQSQKHKATTIFNNIEEEPSVVDYSFVVNAMLLLDCMIGADEYKYLFMDRVKLHFPHTYELAERLNRELFAEEISHASIYRRNFIKGLIICDEFLLQHMPESAQHRKLTENISISYIPSEMEMPRKVQEVFYFKETINSYLALSKKDFQASYILDKSNNIEAIENMTVEEFIARTDRIKITEPNNAVNTFADTIAGLGRLSAWP